MTSLLRRARLTLRHAGPAELLRRALELPLAASPSLRRRITRRRVPPALAEAMRWHEEHGRVVAVVVRGHRTHDCARALRRTEGVRVVARVEDAGPDEDVVLLDGAAVPAPGWLAALQHGAAQADDIAALAPKLLHADGTLRSAGLAHRPGSARYERRFAGRHGAFLGANVTAPALALEDTCAYLTRTGIDCLGPPGGDLAAWCRAAWSGGLRVLHWPAAVVQAPATAEDPPAAPVEQRSVSAPGGGLRIVYVTEDNGIGGGHRVIYQHLNGLAARGHEAELWSFAGPPDWFPLQVPVRRFTQHAELIEALAGLDAIKVATWWNSAAPVWRAAMHRGRAVYFVQDLETSYYPDDAVMQASILDSYRPEFHYLTTSGWVADRLRELGHEPAIVAPGIELDRFFPLDDAEREERVVLAVGRANPLKNFPLTRAAHEALREPRPELRLYGVEPELAPPGARYVKAPTDDQVNELYNTATLFLQTSIHEGFCLPILEAMATGVPVVCTDADGNRDFCRDGENCLMPEASAAAVAAAIQRVLDDAELRARLSAAGMATAREHDWAARIDALERFYLDVASA